MTEMPMLSEWDDVLNQVDVLHKSHERLRQSHGRLLAAAKEAKDMLGDLAPTEAADVIERLGVAIAEAEKV